MQDKTFELIEKMYVDFSKRFENIDKRFEDMDKRFEDMDKRFEDMDKRFDCLEHDVKDVKKEVTQLGIKIDSEITEKIRGLYDSRSITSEKLDDVDEKVDNLQINVNSLTMKAAYSDSRIIKMSKEIKLVK